MHLSQLILLGLGFECGLYVKELRHGFISEDQNNLKVGDYVMKVLPTTDSI